MVYGQTPPEPPGSQVPEPVAPENRVEQRRLDQAIRDGAARLRADLPNWRLIKPKPGSPPLPDEVNPPLSGELQQILVAGYHDLVHAMVEVKRQIGNRKPWEYDAEYRTYNREAQPAAQERWFTHFVQSLFGAVEPDPAAAAAVEARKEAVKLWRHGTAGTVDMLLKRIRASHDLRELDTSRIPIDNPDPELFSRMHRSADGRQASHADYVREMASLKLMGTVIHAAVKTVSGVDQVGHVDWELFGVRKQEITGRL